MSDDIILETQGLTREFAGFSAVSNVDLRVRRGTIHALIGPNGAGKTTCFNLLTKFLQPTRGTIRYQGQDITDTRPDKLVEMGMARSFQISAVFPYLSLIENVRLALQRRLGTSFHFWRSTSSLKHLDRRAEELLESVGLAGMGRTKAVDLSYGRKRALEMATTLATDPMLLLLDEPMAGVGHEDIDSLAELIRTVAVGRTVLMVEHNLNVVSSLCDTVTVLRRGEILAEGSYNEVAANPLVIEAYLGVSDE